jgi:hypothetical protein
LVLGDEVLGRCLLSATKLALAGKIYSLNYSIFLIKKKFLGTADQDEHCRKFMEILIPDAFRKVKREILVFLITIVRIHL